MDIEEFEGLIDDYQAAQDSGRYKDRVAARTALKDAWRGLEAERDALRADAESKGGMSIEEEFEAWLMKRKEYGALLAFAAWKAAYARGRSDAELQDARMREAAFDLYKALLDCVLVMERDLEGLPVIQPELKKARIALAKARSED